MPYSKAGCKDGHRTGKRRIEKTKQNYLVRLQNHSTPVYKRSLRCLEKHCIIERLSEEVADVLWVSPSSLGKDGHVFLIISNDNRRPQRIENYHV